MPVETLRPASTIQNPHLTVVDSTAHGATSDDSDSTYLEGHTVTPGEETVLGLTSHTLASDVGIYACRITGRSREGDVEVAQRRDGSTTSFDGPFTGDTFEDWSGPWESLDPTREEWSLDTVDDVRIVLRHTQLSGDPQHPITAELYFEIDYRESPTATYTAPTGTVTDTSTPTVEWTYDAVDSDNDPQDRYEVRVYHGDDQPGTGWPADPDDITADAVYEASEASADESHTITEPLPENDVTYQVYVRVRKQLSSTDLWSDWDSGSFTLDLATASAPGVTLTAEPSDARIRIDLVDDGTGEGGSADWFTVEYRDASGDAWQWVRDGRQVDADASGEATLYDHEAPLNATREYRARSVIGNGTEIVGPATSDTSPTLDTGNTRWLKDPHDSTRNTVIHAQSYSHSRRGRQEVHRPVGMSAAVVEAEEPGGLDGTYSIVTRTTSEHDAVRDLVDSPGTLLLQDRRHSRYVRVTGDRSFDQQGPDDTGIDLINITVVETTRPSVD